MSLMLDRLQNRLSYVFSEPQLLLQALTHRSYASVNNERLEFLGDAILNYTIARDLYDRFPSAKEGQLSRFRAALVKGETLAKIAREFEIGKELLLGPGELKSGGFRRSSILADALEAIIGAISLDSSEAKAQACVLQWYDQRLSALNLSDNIKDSKSRLQEWLQAKGLPLPVYDVRQIEGESHHQHFVVECQVSVLPEATSGQGGSRRMAEQEAAKVALQKLEQK